MTVVRTKTTYLEMLAPPGAGMTPDVALSVERAVRPSVEFYRFLYNSVGRDYLWVDRNRMPDETLQQILNDDLVEVYVLNVAGKPAGYAELDRRTPGEVELAYFGLFPAYVGQGWGKQFLRWTVQQAWSCRPRRVWVHTCDLDHPAALPNYLQAGFTIYDEQMVDQVVTADAR
jgi:GNAT superfamily N-acetyltransferase